MIGEISRVRNCDKRNIDLGILKTSLLTKSSSTNALSQTGDRAGLNPISISHPKIVIGLSGTQLAGDAKHYRATTNKARGELCTPTKPLGCDFGAPLHYPSESPEPFP